MISHFSWWHDGALRRRRPFLRSPSRGFSRRLNFFPCALCSFTLPRRHSFSSLSPKAEKRIFLLIRTLLPLRENSSRQSDKLIVLLCQVGKWKVHQQWNREEERRRRRRRRLLSPLTLTTICRHAAAREEKNEKEED